MLLGAALVPNDLDWAVAERGEDGLRVHGSVRLLLASGLLILGCRILVAEPCVLRAARLALVDGLLRATVADHQRIVVAQQLVIIDCSVDHPHIGATVMLAPLLLLVLISNYCRGSVHHMVLCLVQGAVVAIRAGLLGAVVVMVLVRVPDLVVPVPLRHVLA